MMQGARYLLLAALMVMGCLLASFVVGAVVRGFGAMEVTAWFAAGATFVGLLWFVHHEVMSA